MAADVATLPEPLEEDAPPRGHHGATAWGVWLLRRVGLALLTLWLVSILVFFATTALGDPVRAILGKDYNAQPQRVAQLHKQLNLDQSAVQRYFNWLGGLLHGDLGTSIANGQPVGPQISDNVTNT